MLKNICFGASLFVLANTAAFAQEGSATMETVIVTAANISDRDYVDTPNATLTVRADFVLFEVTYVNGTVDPRERKSQMERMYNQVIKVLPRHDGLKLSVGDVEASADIDTSVFNEVYFSNGTRGQFDLVVKADVLEGETHNQIRARVNKFIKAAGEIGRSQSILSDEQYLGIDNLQKYRPALIQTIWDDIYAVSNPIGETELDIEGLEQRTRYRPIGPLELQLFIPYEINYTTKVSRER